MASFKKTISTAKAKVAAAETRAFMARLEAIDAILQDAAPHDVAMLCAHALAAVAPLCCEAHEDEFRADFLRMLSDCVAQEQDAAGADGDDDTPAQVH
jgi:hypothetical protein